jgi:hypothetical protein
MKMLGLKMLFSLGGIWIKIHLNPILDSVWLNDFKTTLSHAKQNNGERFVYLNSEILIRYTEPIKIGSPSR